MKTRFLFLFVFLILGFSTVPAQKISENKVPKDVVISFKYKYPDATVSTWELNSDLYIAKFKLNNQESKAEFNDKGVWNVTRYNISEKELPGPILNFYKDNYRNKQFNISVSELHKNNEGKTFYYLQLKKEQNNQIKPIELTFDLNGKLLSKTGQDEIDLKNESTEKSNKKDKKQTDQEENVVKPDENQKYIIDVAEVPADAKTHFASKVKKATGAVWYLQDKIYTVRFIIAGKNGQSTYDKNGVWIETRLEQPQENLHQLIASYLKENYRTYIIKSIELVTQPKDKSILIRMYDKKSLQDPPPLTEIWFSTIGKFLSVTKPDIIDYDYLESKKRKEDADKEFLSEIDKEGIKYEEAENYNDKVNFKELPSPIPQYLKQNYKEHLVKSTRFVSDDELGNVYQIDVKREDSRDEAHLFFDILGNFLKKMDDADIKSNSDNNITNEDKQTPAITEKKYGTSEESVNAQELPTNISKYLKKNYPQHTIAESYFKYENEFGNCYLLVMKKNGDRKIILLYFDLDGNLLKNEIDSQ